MKDEQKSNSKSPFNGFMRFFKTLFDFSFSEFITVQMFPVLYGLMLASVLFGVFYLSVEAFLISVPRGLFYLFIAGPIAFIAIAAVLRALMEFYIVIFRIAQNIEELHDMMMKFSGFTETMDEMKGLTKRLPFWTLKPKVEPTHPSQPKPKKEHG